MNCAHGQSHQSLFDFCNNGNRKTGVVMEINDHSGRKESKREGVVYATGMSLHVPLNFGDVLIVHDCVVCDSYPSTRIYKM